MIKVGDVYRARDFQGRLIRVMDIRTNSYTGTNDAKLLLSDTEISPWISFRRIKHGLSSGKLSTVDYGDTITPSRYMKCCVIE